MVNNPESTEQNIDLAHQQNRKTSYEETRSQRYTENRQNSHAARLCTGEHTAAEELVDQNYQQIYLFMRRLGHNRQVSEDLTQDTFLQAWRHIVQLRDGRALSSWLYRIASNVSKLYWRRHKDRRTVNIEMLNLPDSITNEHNRVEYNEQLSLLKIAVEQLPLKLRQAIILHYMQHLSISEAAEAAGLREGTFKSRLNRALKILRKRVA
jgi:RNA polymerase sigma-70 factor (ECF subfamily)